MIGQAYAITKPKAIGQAYAIEKLTAIAFRNAIAMAKAIGPAYPIKEAEPIAFAYRPGGQKGAGAPIRITYSAHTIADIGFWPC